MKKLSGMIYDFTGSSEPKSKKLPEGIFGLKSNKVLLAEAVKIFLSNQRKSKAKALRRGEVSGSGKKIWRQKGTGHARHGDMYAPIFVGGGVAHGPVGKENWKHFLPSKKIEKAIKVALSQKLADKQVVFINNFEKVTPKTKEAEKCLLRVLKDAFELNKDNSRPKTTLVFGKKSAEKIRLFRNLSWVKIARVESLNPYLILNNCYLVFAEDALNDLESKVSEKEGN